MSGPGDTLDELVDGIRARSDEAFAAVYRLTASRLASFAFGMLADRGAAEDAVQQAFLELTRAAPTLRGEGRSLRAWLYRSVRFTCLDELRRRSRHPELLPGTLPESFHTDPETFDPDLHAALQNLSDRQRALVVLRHVVGLSAREVAGVMGGTRTAIYAATGRAERRLRQELQGIESGELPASVEQGDKT